MEGNKYDVQNIRLYVSLPSSTWYKSRFNDTSLMTVTEPRVRLSGISRILTLILAFPSSLVLTNPLSLILAMELSVDSQMYACDGIVSG